MEHVFTQHSQRDLRPRGSAAARIVHGLSPHVRAILRRVRQRLDQPLTLKQIANDLGRQAEYLGWLFRHETGRTFHEHLTIVRLRRAARLIRAGEKIDAVVLLIGYRSKKNFYEQFRRLFGMTPGEYRDRLHRGDPVPRARTCAGGLAPGDGQELATARTNEDQLSAARAREEQARQEQLSAVRPS